MFSLFITLLNLIALISADPVRESIDSLINDGNNMVGVIGGERATLSDAPYQAYIQISEYNSCGATIIHKRALLTAAHCLDGLDISNIQYWYGGINRTNLTYQVNANKIIIHPKYNIIKYDADIAVVILQNDIVLSSNVKIIKLADKTPLFGNLAKLTGWGKDGYGHPTMLMQTHMTIADYDECNTYFNNLGLKNGITPNMVCAQSLISSAGAGDSGGPLVVAGEQVGVLSFGSAIPRDPTDKTTLYFNGFTDVAIFKTWIEEQIVKYVE